MLHILTKSPFQFDMKSLFLMISQSDDVLAIQEGIVVALNENIYLNKLTKCSKNLYVLKNDIEANGLDRCLSKYFTSVNYSFFVNLTVKHNKLITW